MLYNLFEYAHNSMGIHFWDLPAILTAVVIVIVLIVHSHNQKKRENDFEAKRKEKLETLANEAAGESAGA